MTPAHVCASFSNFAGLFRRHRLHFPSALRHACLYGLSAATPFACHFCRTTPLLFIVPSIPPRLSTCTHRLVLSYTPLLRGSPTEGVLRFTAPCRSGESEKNGFTLFTTCLDFPFLCPSSTSLLTALYPVRLLLSWSLESLHGALIKQEGSRNHIPERMMPPHKQRQSHQQIRHSSTLELS